MSGKVQLRLFAVIRTRGPAWQSTVSVEGQQAWGEHAEFMNALAAVGVVILQFTVNLPLFTAILFSDAGCRAILRLRGSSSSQSPARRGSEARSRSHCLRGRPFPLTARLARRNCRRRDGPGAFGRCQGFRRDMSVPSPRKRGIQSEARGRRSS